jgi:hypothetical protein
MTFFGGCPSSLRHGQHAYTLLEIAIMLIILGLMIGGVVMGQSLVHAAERRSVIEDIERFNFAVKSFLTVYQALPGDMPDATSVWGSANPDPETCKSTPSIGKETCNGDGNGRIRDYIDGATYYEMFRAWQHLVNAGMIDGFYNGVADPLCSFCLTAGVNVPKSYLQDAGYLLSWLGSIPSGDPSQFAGEYGHTYEFGRQTPGSWSGGPVMSPDEAIYFDIKLDDGKPGTGNVRGPKSTAELSPGCTTSDDPSTATYVKSEDNLCTVYFLADF